MDRIAAAVLAFSLAVCQSSCSLFCDSKCDGTPTPVQGNAAMFTLGGVERDGYRVSALAPCGADKQYVTITGTGSKRFETAIDGGCVQGAECTVSRDSIMSELYARLNGRGGHAGSGYGMPCGQTNVSGIYFEIYDYAEADSATETMGELLRDEDLGEAVYLTIGPMQHACAQSACGW